MRKFTSLLLLGFALGSFAQTPGGVSGSELWFKTAPLNSDLQGYYRWQDFSGDSIRLMLLDSRGVKSELTLPNSSVHYFNFNPSLWLADGFRSLSASLKHGDLSQATVIGVFAPELATIGKDMVVYALDGRKGDGAILSKDKAVRGRGVEPLDYGSASGEDLLYQSSDSLSENGFKESALRVVSYFKVSNPSTNVNYRTEETPSESENVNNNHAYEYDANGNLVYVNTSRTKKDGMADEKTAERKLKWDEENRLLASDDNGFVTNYWYDADGERTVKTSGESDQVYVNSEFAGGRTNTAKFSLYVSPYLVANQGGRYTKHIYIGSQRVVSKIGDFDSYGSDPRRIQYAGSETDGLSVDYKQKYVQQLQVIKDNYATFAVPYNGEDNNDYVDGKGFCCNDGSLEAAQARVMARAMKNNFQEGDSYEKMQFYYHPDHLGSSSYITNLDGEVVQHIEYVPFGEVFIEERNNIWNTPYLFNAKEFDEETGLYYYGARYYDPRVSLWISTDILEEKNYGNSSYAYTYNPITFIDPIGTDTINISYVNKKWKIDAPIIADGNDVFNVANGDKKETYEFSQGEHGKRVNLLNLEIGETKDSYTLGVYHISGEADNGTGFYVAPGGEPSTKNGSGRRIPDGTYPIINPTAGSQWIKPGVGGNVSKRGIRFHYGGTNPRSWTEGCFVLSSGYSVNGNTIHYNADESKTASRNFDNALGAIGHFSYRPKSRTYNREGATFNAPIKHTLILKSRKK